MNPVFIRTSSTIVIPSAARNLPCAGLCRRRFLAALGMTSVEGLSLKDLPRIGRAYSGNSGAP